MVTSGEDNSFRGRQRRAMVVEDNDTVREMVSRLLREKGFDVFEASSGHEAVALLGRIPIDLLLCDLVLPGPDGLNVISAAGELSPDAISIIITGNATLDSARRAVKTGVSDYLTKPFSAQELMEAIETARSAKAREARRTRAHELKGLFELSCDFTDIDGPRQMLNITTSTAVIQTQSDVACIGTVDDGDLVPVSVSPNSQRVYSSMYAGDGLLADVIDRRKPILVSTAGHKHPLSGQLDVRSTADEANTPKDGEALAIPLVSSSKAFGALAVVRFDAATVYTAVEYRFICVLAAQAALLLSNLELIDGLEQAYMGTVEAMVRAVEARDEYTYGHSHRVSETAGDIARHLGVPSDRIDTLQRAARLHDVGKIAIPDNVLRKAGELTEQEWEMVRAHPVVGVEMLAPATFLEDTIPFIRHHHERHDGTGYPDGIGHQQLDEMSEILIAADAFDAMSSHRPYRPALTRHEVLREFDRCKGSQFAPRIAETVLDLYAVAA